MDEGPLCERKAEGFGLAKMSGRVDERLVAVAASLFLGTMNASRPSRQVVLVAKLHSGLYC